MMIDFSVCAAGFCDYSCQVHAIVVCILCYSCQVVVVVVDLVAATADYSCGRRSVLVVTIAVHLDTVAMKLFAVVVHYCSFGTPPLVPPHTHQNYSTHL